LLGEMLVFDGLDKVYKNVRRTAKNMAAQLKYADIFCTGFPQILIPDLRYEVKTEFQHTGNLFWETYSNKGAGRKGWGFTSPADVLYYLFWNDGKGYRIDGLQRKIWVFDNHWKHKYPEVKQKKYDQENDTWGCLIPVNANWLESVEFDFSSMKSRVESVL